MNDVSWLERFPETANLKMIKNESNKHINILKVVRFRCVNIFIYRLVYKNRRQCF